MHAPQRLDDDAPAPGSPCRSILVGLGSGHPDSRTLAVAAALARRECARLTVLAAVVRPSILTWAAPIALPYDPARAAEEECVARLRAAVAGLPADMSVTAVLRREPAPDALLAELAAGPHDLVVVGGGRSRRTRRPASRTARILFGRSRVPVLVVSAVRLDRTRSARWRRSGLRTLSRRLARGASASRTAPARPGG